MITFEKVRDDFENTKDKMLSRANSSGAMARIYSLYQSFQTKRFQTQNASEGKTWTPLKPKYRQRKLTTFRTYPGSGTKMMIATGTLAGAVIGPGAPFSGVDKHRAVFKTRSMEIYVQESGSNAANKPFTYAKYAAENRPFMEFSDEHINQMKDALIKFILGF